MLMKNERIPVIKPSSKVPVKLPHATLESIKHYSESRKWDLGLLSQGVPLLETSEGNTKNGKRSKRFPWLYENNGGEKGRYEILSTDSEIIFKCKRCTEKILVIYRQKWNNMITLSRGTGYSMRHSWKDMGIHGNTARPNEKHAQRNLW